MAETNKLVSLWGGEIALILEEIEDKPEEKMEEKNRPVSLWVGEIVLIPEEIETDWKRR